MPGYLKGYESQWARNPREANLAWFRDSELGMFVHFSPASGIGTEGWEKVNPTWDRLHRNNSSLDPSAYGNYLLDKFEPNCLDGAAGERIEAFTGSRFNADSIAELAVAAGMNYITFTTQHVVGRLFLFDTEISDLNSVKLAAKRDFVAEMAAACRKQGLGLFLYVMPPYVDPSVRSLNRRMLTELLTRYGPLAGIWFDGIGEAMKRPQSFGVEEVSETYALVRKLQPHCLISFKTGYTGEEDFIAPEKHHCKYDEEGLPTLERKGASERIRELWKNKLRHKYIQSSYTLLAGNRWFHAPGSDHRSIDEILSRRRLARERKQSLLLNLAPLYDGSLHPKEVALLKDLSR